MGYGSEANITRALLKAAKWVYWIVGLLLVIGGAYYLYNTLTRPISGVLVFLAGILALYFYYVKWFVVGVDQATWPPYQTSCPDFLTVASVSSNGTVKCVDTIGVSRNGNLRKADSPPTSLQLSDPNYYFEITPADLQASGLNGLRAKVQNKGLTWSTLFNE